MDVERSKFFFIEEQNDLTPRSAPSGTLSEPSFLLFLELLGQVHSPLVPRKILVLSAHAECAKQVIVCCFTAIQSILKIFDGFPLFGVTELSLPACQCD
ncbi:hypothetical protein D3C73_1305230 [compost metagenome]